MNVPIIRLLSSAHRATMIAGLFAVSRPATAQVAVDSATVTIAVRRPASGMVPAATHPIYWYGAPYAAELSALRGAGAVIDGVDLAPAGARSTTRRFQLLDRLVLTLPRGTKPSLGSAMLLVRRGPSLGAAQVLLPTGIAVVDGEDEGFVTARLTRVFDVVEAGHAVVPMPDESAPSTADRAPLRDTRVAWVAGAAELPTVKSIVVLAGGVRAGVREGDLFELVGDGRRIPGGPFLPGTRVAVVRVVRVTEQGASAIVESQQQPAISPGMVARPIER